MATLLDSRNASIDAIKLDQTEFNSRDPINDNASNFQSVFHVISILTSMPCEYGSAHIVTLPCLPPACSSLVELMALTKTTRFFAGSSEASGFTVLCPCQ